MQTAKKVLVVSLLVLAAAAVLAPTLRFLTGPGMGGPEKVAPVKWTGPASGGPEKIVPCCILMGQCVRNDL
jgi:hypothetical protein